MTFSEYQAFAEATALYPQTGHNMVYPALGLAGEAGEVVEKVKKHWRNSGKMDGVLLEPEERMSLLKELGDVLWYLSAMARELGSDLDYVARFNISKLQDRKNRGVIKSEGDDR